MRQRRRHSELVLIALAFFCFPIGLILVWREPLRPTRWKLVYTPAYLVPYLLVLASEFFGYTAPFLSAILVTGVAVAEAMADAMRDRRQRKRPEST